MFKILIKVDVYVLNHDCRCLMVSNGSMSDNLYTVRSLFLWGRVLLATRGLVSPLGASTSGYAS